MPLLTQPQLESFKADGYLVLPDALNVELVKQLRDESWREIESFVRLRQDKPSSWAPLLQEDVRHLRRISRHLRLVSGLSRPLSPPLSGPSPPGYRRQA